MTNELTRRQPAGSSDRTGSVVDRDRRTSAGRRSRVIRTAP